MATTSKLSARLQFIGDIDLDDTYSITDNAASPGQSEFIDLSSGANTITLPSGGSSVPVGCIIIPPTGNIVALTLKGVGGDTGILLHPTNPHVQSFGSGVTTFVLNAASAINGVRLIFF